MSHKFYCESLTYPTEIKIHSVFTINLNEVYKTLYEKNIFIFQKLLNN